MEEIVISTYNKLRRSELAFRRGFKTDANRIAAFRGQMGLEPTAPIDPFSSANALTSGCSASASWTMHPLFSAEDNRPSRRSPCPAAWTRRSCTTTLTIPTGSAATSATNSRTAFSATNALRPLTEAGERARDGSIEAEANYLAGTLLMTNEAALHVVRTGIVAQAQNLYGISGAMLTYRLRVSGAHTICQRMSGLPA